MATTPNHPPVVIAGSPTTTPTPPALSSRRVFAELLGFGAAGLAVFLYEGLRAHPSRPRTLSDEPLALFVWFIALMVEAESLAARMASHKDLLLGRWAKWSLYALTVVAALIAGLVRIASVSTQVTDILSAGASSVTSALGYVGMHRPESSNALNVLLNAVNALLLAPFVLLIVVHVGHGNSKKAPPAPATSVGQPPAPNIPSAGQANAPNTPTSGHPASVNAPAGKRIVADFLTLAIVSLCLSALMNQLVLSSITASLQHPIGGPGQSCDLALAATSCDPTTGPQPLATLTALDAFFVPATCIVVAAFLVTMAAVWNALKSLTAEAFVGAFISGLMAELSIRFGLANVFMWARLLWWVPVIVAAAAATELAFAAQGYLVGVVADDTPPGQLGGLLFFDANSAIYQDQLAAVELAAVIIIAVYSAVSLLRMPGLKKSCTQSPKERRETVKKAGELWRQGVWLTAVVLLLVYGVFSLLLWLINALVVGIWNVSMPHAHVPTPFIQPDFLALFAALVFCYYGIRRLVDNHRSRAITSSGPAISPVPAVPTTPAAATYATATATATATASASSPASAAASSAASAAATSTPAGTPTGAATETEI
jgi:hypothetical protein